MKPLGLLSLAAALVACSSGSTPPPGQRQSEVRGAQGSERPADDDGDDGGKCGGPLAIPCPAGFVCAEGGEDEYGMRTCKKNACDDESCKGDEAPTLCVPYANAQCRCPNDKAGTKKCAADGNSYGVCRC